MDTRVVKEFLRILGKGALFVTVVLGGILGLTFAAVKIFGTEWGSFLGIVGFWLGAAIYGAWDYAKVRVKLQQEEEQRLIDTIASQTGSQ